MRAKRSFACALCAGRSSAILDLRIVVIDCEKDVWSSYCFVSWLVTVVGIVELSRGGWEVLVH